MAAMTLPATDYVLRDVRIDDLQVVAEHRYRMFLDAGRGSEASLAPMMQAYLHWLQPRLQDGRYYGWLVESAGEPVAGLGMMTIDWPPHPLHLRPERGYILDVYVHPQHRRCGLAARLTQRALEEARHRGLALMVLHATEQGRPVYEQAGFAPTSEMQLRLLDDSRPTVS